MSYLNSVSFVADVYARKGTTGTNRQIVSCPKCNEVHPLIEYKGELMCQECADSLYAIFDSRECLDCGKNFPIEQLIKEWIGGNDDDHFSISYYCNECYTPRCRECRDHLPVEELLHVGDEYICKSCNQDLEDMHYVDVHGEEGLVSTSS